jgi:succinate-semialdehyde dehydrogenase/glutarate-semialdehyde dehydrogenase
VEEAVREQFTDLFIARLRAARVGEPLAAETTVGPLARADLREELHALVQHSVTAGARLLLGGQMPAGKGCYYPVTALDGVRPGMPVFDEETFGPVAAIVAAKDEADAVRLANQSVFGLGAAVFTGDRQRGERVARQLAAGCCAVNDFVKSDPRLPFGGIKDSGYGRELGCIGIREFVNIKSVVVA